MQSALSSTLIDQLYQLVAQLVVVQNVVIEFI
jgi:hypothetical protein